jgi:hypothetical protein
VDCFVIVASGILPGRCSVTSLVFSAVFPRRVSGSADHSGADPTSGPANTLYAAPKRNRRLYPQITQMPADSNKERIWAHEPHRLHEIGARHLFFPSIYLFRVVSSPRPEAHGVLGNLILHAVAAHIGCENPLMTADTPASNRKTKRVWTSHELGATIANPREPVIRLADQGYGHRVRQIEASEGDANMNRGKPTIFRGNGLPHAPHGGLTRRVALPRTRGTGVRCPRCFPFPLNHHFYDCAGDGHDGGRVGRLSRLCSASGRAHRLSLSSFRSFYLSY